MIFIYKARNGKGELIEGEIDAKGVLEAKYMLAEDGLFPTSVGSKGISISLPNFIKLRGKVKVKELINLTRQFYALFKAGINMDRILFTLARQSPTQQMKNAMESIRRDVASGSSLSVAFSKYPRYFDELYVNMLNVGEQGGVLQDVLKRLNDILKKENKLVTNVKSATLYPKIVLFVFFCVTSLMLIYVIPRFAEFYASFSAELPLPTKILIGMSDFAQKYWYIVLAAVAAIVIAYKKFQSTKKGKVMMDRVRFKLPVFGHLHLMVVNARFGHLVSSLYKSGLSINKALEITGRTIGNEAFKKEIDELNEDVRKGTSLADSMSVKRYFTVLTTETVAVGEQTGALDEMLETTAQFYDEEVDYLLDQLTTLIEPMLLVGIFAMVGLLALAIFLPWWNVTRLILQGGGG